MNLENRELRHALARCGTVIADALEELDCGCPAWPDCECWREKGLDAAVEALAVVRMRLTVLRLDLARRRLLDDAALRGTIAGSLATAP